MVNISKDGIIELTRGDSFKYPLFINCNTDLNPKRYNLKDTDVIYFALMEPNQRFENAILKKTYSNSDNMTEYGDIFICLDPSDTANLLPGKYYYTLKLKYTNSFNDEVIRTIVPERLFYIL